MRFDRSLPACVVAGCLVLPQSDANAQPKEILWSALRPPAESMTGVKTGAIGSESDGTTLAWREEMTVELTGFVLPIDREGDLVYEFLLVPWAGACSHVAPPPANQVVRVVPQSPIRISKSFELVSVAGALRPGLEKAQLFILDGVRVVDFGYTVSRAKVIETTRRRDPDLKAMPPGSFLSR